MPDGSETAGAQAEHWASVFLNYLQFEPGPTWLKPQARKRPERPTADRPRRFIGLEADWIRALRAASLTLGGLSVLLLN